MIPTFDCGSWLNFTSCFFVDGDVEIDSHLENLIMGGHSLRMVAFTV